MKKIVLILLAALAFVVSGCTSEKGAQQLETALFEEKQNNREHAIKLYEEIISKYPGTPNAKKAEERLDALKGRR